MNPYEELGVERGATEQEIRSVWRKRAKEQHPDLFPGDPTAKERFQRLQSAYDVLIDEERRAKYDQTGSVDEDPPIEGRAKEAVFQAAQAAVGRFMMASVTSIDIVDEMRKYLSARAFEFSAQVTFGKQTMERYEKLRKNINGKIIERVIDDKIRDAARHISAMEQNSLIAARALEIIDGYKHNRNDSEFDHQIFLTGGRNYRVGGDMS